MKIEEAVVYLLSTAGCGMSTDTLARQINLQELHLRKDGKPVTSEQVYACCMRYKEMFVKDGYPPQYTPEVFREVMDQVENFKENEEE